MSFTYKTPGVYVEEAFNQTVSIPNVATSIPAFFGKTAQGGSAKPSPVRISNFLEFREHFGMPASPTWDILPSGNSFKVDGNPQNAVPEGEALLYYAVQWYFLNGGGPCYIVAVAEDEVAQYEAGLAAIGNFDEPTLVVPCGAINLASDKYYAFCKSALAQSMQLRDRFCILDVVVESDAATVSQRVAADVDVFRNNIGVDNLPYGAAYYPYMQTLLAWEYNEADLMYDGSPLDTLGNKGLHAKITAWLRSQNVVLPPSAAIAGVYGTVDNDRGVWKAPANVGLNYAGKPIYAINDSEQDDMNVPAGMAPVNALRHFSGNGTLIWGAKTLDYKSADWTYVSVRRLFIMVEESIAKAVNAFVFEANDKTTWTNVKSSVNSYLYQLWSQGALAGGKAEEAFVVQVGLGETMTMDDVKEGRMVVEIRLAPVRPAEYIIITFTQNVKGA